MILRTDYLRHFVNPGEPFSPWFARLRRPFTPVILADNREDYTMRNLSELFSYWGRISSESEKSQRYVKNLS